jgi:hypothetical protein
MQFGNRKNGDREAAREGGRHHENPEVHPLTRAFQRLVSSLATVAGVLVALAFASYIVWQWSTGIVHWATYKPTPSPTPNVFSKQVGKAPPERAAVSIQSDSGNGDSSTEIADLTVSPDTDQNDVEVNKVDWPNGGYSSFKDCSLPNYQDPATCTATNGDGETYDISLAQ